MDKPEARPRDELRESLIEKAQKKYLPNRSENAELFWEILVSEITFHAEASEQNKTKHFQENEYAIGVQALLTTGDKHSKWIVWMFRLIAIALLSLLSSWTTNNLIVSTLISFSSFLLIIWAFCMAYSTQAKRLQLKLRRYGETWVRHSTALAALEQELMLFVYEIGAYNLIPLEMQQKQFEAHILNIRAQNQKQFEENMLNLEEYVDS